MKKRSNLILFLLCAVIFIFCGCSTYRVIKDATDHEEGRLIMKDGTEYVGRVKMPNGKTKKLRMRTTDGRKGGRCFGSMEEDPSRDCLFPCVPSILHNSTVLY